MFAESTNRWPILAAFWEAFCSGKIGGRFGKSVADFACCYFSETYFWARFGTILWEFLLL